MGGYQKVENEVLDSSQSKTPLDLSSLRVVHDMDLVMMFIFLVLVILVVSFTTTFRWTREMGKGGRAINFSLSTSVWVTRLALFMATAFLHSKRFQILRLVKWRVTFRYSNTKTSFFFFFVCGLKAKLQWRMFWKTPFCGIWRLFSSLSSAAFLSA